MNASWLHSPAKNVWLVDVRPRDIAKFKMAAIPPSFVYSIGKKIYCRLIWVANAYTNFLRIAQTFYYPFSPILMGFVPCDARVLAGLPDSALDLFERSLFTITKDNNISDKSWATRKNGLCWQLNAAEKKDTMGPLKLLRHLEVFFFHRKDRAKFFFLQQDFIIYKKKLEHELNELWCLHSCSFHFERVQF